MIPMPKFVNHPPKTEVKELDEGKAQVNTASLSEDEPPSKRD